MLTDDGSKCGCVTCHVAVDQLRFDWSAAVHVDIKMSRCVAIVFVCLTGLFIHSWKENNEINNVNMLAHGSCQGMEIKTMED